MLFIRCTAGKGRDEDGKCFSASECEQAQMSVATAEKLAALTVPLLS